MSGFFAMFRSPKQTFSFEFLVEALEINFSKAVNISFTLKRSEKHLGNQKVESQNYPYSPSIGSVEANESLIIISTIFQDKNKNFKAKSAEIIITAHAEKNIHKKLGMIEFNIADFCMVPIKSRVFPLKECFDKNAKLRLSIFAKPINDQITDNFSEFSGLPMSHGTDDVIGSMISEDSEKNRSGKPPISAEFKENHAECKGKIEALEETVKALTTEKNNLKVQIAVAFEKYKSEREEMIGHMQDLELRLNEELEANSKLLKRNGSYKQKSREKRQEIAQFQEKTRNLETSISELTQGLEKAKRKKKILKENLKETSTNGEKYLNEILNQNKIIKELKEKFNFDSTFPNKSQDSENFSDRSRRNSEKVSLLKEQVQVLEDQKEAALSKQTELVFTIQKNKIQMANAKDCYDNEIGLLKSEISQLKSENESLQYTKLMKNSIKVQDSGMDGQGKMELLFKNFHELKTRKEEAEKVLKNYEVLNENEVNYVQDLQNQLKIKESALGSLKVELQLKEKEEKAILKVNECLNREVSTLRSQIKLFTESEFSDPATVLLQEQVISYENTLNSVTSELEKERKQHAAETQHLLAELVKVKSSIQESEELYNTQITQLTIEKELLQKKNSGNPFAQSRKSTAEFVYLAQEENFNQTLQIITLEVQELKKNLQVLQEKNVAQGKKLEKKKKKLKNTESEKEKSEKAVTEAKKQLEEYSKLIKKYDKKVYNLNLELITVKERVRELEIGPKSV